MVAVEWNKNCQNEPIRNSSKISGIFTSHRPCPALPFCADLSCRSDHCWGDCNCRLFAITEHRSQKSIFRAMQYKHAVKTPQIAYCGSFRMQFLMSWPDLPLTGLTIGEAALLTFPPRNGGQKKYACTKVHSQMALYPVNMPLQGPYRI